jgi:Tfp pilus assembly protein PilX
MTGRRAQRGIAIIVTLLVLTIIMVIVFAVGAQGIWNLNYVNREKYNLMAFYAAEAGVNESLLKYKKGENGWASGIGSLANPMDLSNGARYYTEVTDNTSGSSDVTASNGAMVPQGAVYFLGTGLYQNMGATKYRICKRVGVMVDPGNSIAFNYAIAAAGSIQVKNCNIYGNVKSDGNLIFNQGNIDVYPANGQARVLCAASIQNGNKWLRLHESNGSDKHDCRARVSLTGPSKCSGGDPTVYPDTTNDTLAFIHDGSLAPDLGPSQMGQKLPNPDMTALLQGATVHNEITGAGQTYGTAITGGTHYFPNGVTLNCAITGNCTIIAGKQGTPGVITYNCSTGSIVNIVAVDGGTGPDWQGNGTAPSNASISFQNQCTVNGLVYCHGSISTQGQFTSNGSIITYKTGAQQMHDGAQANFTFNNDNIKNTPGFEAWFKSAGAGSGKVNIMSWQRT